VGVEIRINTLSEERSADEEIISLTHPVEEVDRTVQFGIHQEGEFKHYYLEPIEGAPSAFKAYRTENSQNGDLPGAVMKKEAPRTYLDIITPANPIVLHAGENGVVFSAHVTPPDTAFLPSIPQELDPGDILTAAD